MGWGAGVGGDPEVVLVIGWLVIWDSEGSRPVPPPPPPVFGDDLDTPTRPLGTLVSTKCICCSLRRCARSQMARCSVAPPPHELKSQEI